MRITKKQLRGFIDYQKFFRLGDEIERLPSASWIFVTHNRCPYSNSEKNPLVWAFQTLINNQLYLINDFIVIDDNSNDHTKASIKWLTGNYNIKIKYIRNKRRISCSASRNVGLKYTKNNLVFMGDDDCLYSEYFLVGSMLTYQMLKRRKPDEKIAVINLPVYEKRLSPEFTVKSEMMGKVMLDKTFFYHEFDKFPLEYLRTPHYLDKNKTILQPLEVATFKGCNLCDKALLSKAGNYPDLEMWPSSYSEHIELSYKLQKKGFSIYHQPDPKFGCLHLKYGNLTRDKFDKKLFNKRLKGLKYSLGQMVLWAQRKRFDTGARLSDNSFYMTEVGSFFSFYLKISDRLGLKFARNQYKIFVEECQKFSTTPTNVIKNKKDRRDIFFAGIKRGIEATEIQTGKDYKRIFKQIVQELSNK